MTEEMAREQVIEAGRRLVSSGLIARTWGNVSCRIDSDYFIITPSGRDYLGLRPEDLVKVSIRDGSYQGTIKPSSEKGIHQDLYEQLPDQNFVIHTHQKYASVIGTLELDQVELLEAYPHLGDVVLCAQYGLPGTKTLRKHVKQAVSPKMGHAILMKNHGALCYGTDMEAAFQTAMELEEACWHWMEHLMEKQYNKAWEQPGMRKEDSERKGSYTRFLTEPIYQQFGSSKDSLYPYLDDFAQIVGTSVKNVGNNKRKANRALKVANAGTGTGGSGRKIDSPFYELYGSKSSEGTAKGSSLWDKNCRNECKEINKSHSNYRCSCRQCKGSRLEIFVGQASRT